LVIEPAVCGHPPFGPSDIVRMTTNGTLILEKIKMEYKSWKNKNGKTLGK
jgi:hypothetical protein